MSVVLGTAQREQAGSDSYNRFEYQAHWIVYHIINQLEKKPKCIVFCEFHDDMAQLADGDGSQFEFYQIKTKEDNDDWSVSELSKREKRKNGSYKKSFLGFIFYNFLKFGDECSCCHFVSNNNYDLDVRTWQSYIEDNKCLADENIKLYDKIKARIKDEYADNIPSNFDEIYDKFIQKTFIYQSELQLSTYEDQVSGMFFKQLADKRIPINTANVIFQQIVNDVRIKSKEKISPPISFRSLVEKKGIKICDINDKLNKKIGTDGNYREFSDFLETLSLPEDKIYRLIKAKMLHDARWLNIEDIKYQETILLLRKTITESTDKARPSLISIKELCDQKLQAMELDSDTLDYLLIEVLYYEQQFRKYNGT